MVQSIDSFLVSEFGSAFIPELEDTYVLKEYIAGKNENCEAAFICNIVEQMAELRFEAEKVYKEEKQGARNARGELRLSVNAMVDKLTLSAKTEPPEQLISVIAKRDYGVIECLLLSMRRVLRRQRSKVQVANVQQIDSQCLRWLARQPGRTAAEKGGESQRLLAVVREETKDTLENRVLKDFIFRASVMARRYLSLYEKQYPDSTGIKNVRRLCRMLQNALRVPELKLIGSIKGNVRPNYVLLHDAMYHKMWVLYRQILAHVRITEMVWPYRYVLFGEFLCCWLSMRLCLEKITMVFDSSYWVSMMPRNGRFLVNPLFTNVYRHAQGILDWRVSRDCGMLTVRNRNEARKTVKLAYVPECVNHPIHIPKDNVLYVVCSFASSQVNSCLQQDNVLCMEAGSNIDEISTAILNKLGI